ncbi:MAG: LptF/LptG family permease [Chloroflexia bacterium]|nr:LptF/LptG family permease [Chloroflexia bacterium]
MALIGVSIASRKVRGGIGVHIGFGLLLSFSYIIFQKLADTFALQANLPPLLAVWIPNFIFGGIAAWLYHKAPK